VTSRTTRSKRAIEIENRPDKHDSAVSVVLLMVVGKKSVHRTPSQGKCVPENKNLVQEVRKNANHLEKEKDRHI